MLGSRVPARCLVAAAGAMPFCAMMLAELAEHEAWGLLLEEQEVSAAGTPWGANFVRAL